MGCGKSSVGRRLSDLLCCPFMDLDEVIEQQSGRTIPEIFATDGEAAFRQMELDALHSLISTEDMVEMGKEPCSATLILSLGGGTVMTPECAALVQENTMCIYLRTSVDTLVARLADEAAGRPLLSAGNVIPNEAEESTSHAMHLRSRIESLMSSRASVYERTADIVIDTDNNTIDSVAQTLAKVVSANR